MIGCGGSSKKHGNIDHILYIYIYDLNHLIYKYITIKIYY